MATNGTTATRSGTATSVYERLDALPPHKRRRVDIEYGQALAYVWGWEDAHGASTWTLPQGFADARREAVLDYVTEQRCSLPSIADHFSAYLTEQQSPCRVGTCIHTDCIHDRL